MSHPIILPNPGAPGSYLVDGKVVTLPDLAIVEVATDEPEREDAVAAARRVLAARHSNGFAAVAPTEGPLLPEDGTMWRWKVACIRPRKRNP